jgi:hypothetical protein
MQGSNDAPFAGNLFRKSSHTTYGRKGRASLATKAGQDSQRQLSPQDMEQKHSDINGGSRMDQASSPEVSRMDRDRALEPRNVGGVPPETADGAASGLKRKVTEEETSDGPVDKEDDAVSGESFAIVLYDCGFQPSCLFRNAEQTTVYYTGRPKHICYIQIRNHKPNPIYHVTNVGSFGTALGPVRRRYGADSESQLACVNQSSRAACRTEGLIYSTENRGSSCAASRQIIRIENTTDINHVPSRYCPVTEASQW